MEILVNNIDGWFDWPDIYAEWVERAGHGATIVEVGAWHGKSTVFLATELRRLRHDIKFYTVDRWDGKIDKLDKETPDECYGQFQANLRKFGVEQFVIPLRMDSLDACDHFRDKSLDYVFLDGAHDYWSVRWDIMRWKEKVKPDGILAGHDYDQDDVKKAVHEIFEDKAQPTGRRSWSVQIADLAVKAP